LYDVGVVVVSECLLISGDVALRLGGNIIEGRLTNDGEKQCPEEYPSTENSAACETFCSVNL